jgi:endonuclease/exonuclease/phosphatase family metal-dependent hydrolase
MNYSECPSSVLEDIIRLRRAIRASGLPSKVTDQNVLIGTWNLRAFGELYHAWTENTGSPKRNLCAMAYIQELISNLDVIAIQEVKRDLSAINLLLDWLGKDWGVLYTDVTAGDPGNAERLAFVFDRRRIQPSGLTGEIVLPASSSAQPITQFARTPFIVGFRAGQIQFNLLTAHIYYGETPQERLEEIRNFSMYIADEMIRRASGGNTSDANLIVLGDFNIDKRSDNPLYQAFVSTGLKVPDQLQGVKTVYGSEPKFYDQIAWFTDQLKMTYTQHAGVIDFTNAVYPELSLQQVSYRISDHFPLWVEFRVDESPKIIANSLNLDATLPDPFVSIPNIHRE